MSNLQSMAKRDGRFMVLNGRYWKSARTKRTRSFNCGYFPSNSSPSLFSSSSSSSLSPSASSERPSESLRKRCCSVIKPQRACFYIMRRCDIMLLCWHGDP